MLGRQIVISIYHRVPAKRGVYDAGCLRCRTVHCEHHKNQSTGMYFYETYTVVYYDKEGLKLDMPA